VKTRRHIGAEDARFQLAVAILVKPILVGSGREMKDFSELNLIGRSPAFLRALSLIRKFATCDATVLVQGEPATGELIFLHS